MVRDTMWLFQERGSEEEVGPGSSHEASLAAVYAGCSLWACHFLALSCTCPVLSYC